MGSESVIMQKTGWKKKQKKHTRCAVCGRDFSAEYDETLKAFPIYHSDTPKKMNEPCENRFYKALLRVYMYLHEVQNSVPISKLVNDFEWLGLVLMKKEMIFWCMDRGYLYVDNLMRVDLPTQVGETCKNIFESTQLNDPHSVEKAVEMLKAALQCLLGELDSVPYDKIPVKQVEELDLGESTLFDNINTSTVQKRSEKEGMVTARRTGAKKVHTRAHSAESSRERKRLEKKMEDD